MNSNREQRFKQFCAAADRIVEETGVDPSKLTGYAISKAAFGKKPNGEIYFFYEEWLKLRHAVPGAPPVDMPAEAEAELENWTDQLKAQIMQRVTGIVRGVAGSFEQTTTMRVGALERLCADQSRRNQAVIATLVETEAELGEAQTRLAACADELRQEREHVQRLLGRLEERDALFQALQPGGGTDSAAPIIPFDPREEHTFNGDENDDSGVARDDAIADVKAPADLPVAVVQETSTANDDAETDATRPAREPAASIGQVEMRLPVARDPAGNDRPPG